MINSIFSNVDQDKTIKKARELLVKYPTMKLRDQMSIVSDPEFVDVSAQSYDGMPASQDNANHEENKMIHRLKDTMELHYEVIMIEKTIGAMNITDRQSYYAHILNYRYLKDWSVVKCCQKLSEEFPDFTGNGYLADSTFNDHRKEALLVFANIYRGGILIVKKVRG